MTMKKTLISLFALAATVVACHKNDPEPDKPEGKVERTVLIYMAGENNLSNWSGTKYADLDLKEMKEGIKTIGNNILAIYVDKAETTPPYLLYYWNGRLIDSIPMPESLTSDPATLETVVRKAFTDYPANSYGLGLWGHATGWLFKNDSIEYTSVVTARKKAYGGDTGNNSSSGAGNTWMNIPSMAKALKHLPHLDFIFADCCNFMCVECAYELRDVTDYLIGSPAEIPAVGAPYEKVVPAMMDKTNFWQAIVDRYYEQHLASGNKVPLAVVKSSEVASLASATRTILHTFEFGDSPYLNMRGTIYYTGYLDNKYLFDMNNIMLKFAPEAEYQSWKQAFDKAVIYSKISEKWDTGGHVNFYDFTVDEQSYGGISMFVPQYRLQNTDNQYIQKMGWYYAAGYSEVGW